MRKAIFVYLDQGGEGLDPKIREALERLKAAEADKSSASVPETSFQGT
jgi:hypothetical protein